MEQKVIRGYWDCPYCESIGINGLLDVCPNCGQHKPNATKHYMKGVEANKTYRKMAKIEKQNLVNRQELEEAGIGEDENDGFHPEWECQFCGGRNNWANKECFSCGVTKAENQKIWIQNKEKIDHALNDSESDALAAEIERARQEAFYGVQKEEKKKKEKVKQHKPQSYLGNWFGRILRRNWWKFGIAGAVIGVAAFLLWPTSKVATVIGFSWERVITLEEYKGVKESGWTVPSGAEVYDEKQEVKGKRKEVDHYEERTVTRTREVPDGFDISYTYEDNGNGTYREVEHKTPKYKKESYEETISDPVYKEVAEYATKYYYTVYKWDRFRSFHSSERGKTEPYWNEEYKNYLSQTIRESGRTEEFFLHYDDGTKLSVTRGTWDKAHAGDTVKTSVNRLGFVYSQSVVE